jgi:hypothetical protein
MNAQAGIDAIGATLRVAWKLGLSTTLNQDDSTRMDSMKVIDQLDTMIDGLLNETDLPAASLASMLMAARDSVKDGYHVALARRVWDVSNAIKGHYSVHADPLVSFESTIGID